MGKSPLCRVVVPGEGVESFEDAMGTSPSRMSSKQEVCLYPSLAFVTLNSSSEPSGSEIEERFQSLGVVPVKARDFARLAHCGR